MSLWPRIPCGLGPTELVLPHLAKISLTHHVINHMPGKDDPIPGFVYQISDYKIIREIIANCLVAADFANRFFFHRDGWAEAEFHAFQQVRDQNSRRHFHRHSDCRKTRPESG